MAHFPTLGELEIQVMEYLWEHSDGTAKSVHEYLERTRPISVNTIQSTLERLFRKNLLSRDKQSHSYVYRAIKSKSALLGSLINDMLERFDSDSQLSAVAIINAAETIDDNALDILEAEIQRRRTEGKS